LYPDLDELAAALKEAPSAADVRGSTLAKFSPASSQQAKLLRLLKTINYTHAAALKALKRDTKSKGRAAEVDKVYQIYHNFKFDPLWEKVGQCLSIIEEKSDMTNIATILLPLIEALMVVADSCGIKPAPAKNAMSPTSETPTPPREADIETLFLDFTKRHRKILNIMVRNNPSLMSGSFAVLMHNPAVLEFDNKRNYFNQQLHRRSQRDHYGTLQVNVRRQYVFEDSYQMLLRRTGDQIKYGKLSVRFYEEEGVDAGGVTREWFQVLARQMFNPNYALFQRASCSSSINSDYLLRVPVLACAADRLTYQPNRMSSVNPDHLSFFKFVGRIIGKAIYDGRLLDAYFTRSFYKVTFSIDVQEVYPSNLTRCL
jgi:E3 ubiquitin-protein ligase HUWE1